MALWLYHKKAPLTRSCDSHVDTLCANFTKGAVLPAEGAVVGVYGQCLTSAVSNITDAECQVLVSVVAVEGAHVGAVIDNDRLQETINKLTQVRLLKPLFCSRAGLPLKVSACIPAALNFCLCTSSKHYAVGLTACCQVGDLFFKRLFGFGYHARGSFVQLELATGQRIHAGSPRGLVLTGWIALAAATALTALLIGLGFLAYRHYYGPKQDYTLVVKEGDV